MLNFKNLRNMPALVKGVPQAMDGFKALDGAALKDGALPKKFKEFMATAVALIAQCGHYLEMHHKAALAAGVTEEELAETAFVAVALRAGATLTHGTHLIANE